jgi:hypothetical protein
MSDLKDQTGPCERPDPDSISETDLVSPRPNTVRLELFVPEAQLPELNAAWREIVGGKRTRMDLLEREVSAITRRALESLRVIETAIRRNPTTGQAGRLVRFLAGVYNGYTRSDGPARTRCCTVKRVP